MFFVIIVYFFLLQASLSLFVDCKVTAVYGKGKKILLVFVKYRATYRMFCDNYEKNRLFLS